MHLHHARSVGWLASPLHPVAISWDHLTTLRPQRIQVILSASVRASVMDEPPSEIGYEFGPTCRAAPHLMAIS